MAINEAKHFFKDQFKRGNLIGESQFNQFLTDLSGEDEAFCKEANDWYKKICSLSFLNEIPEDIQEIFFLSSNEVFYQDNTGRHIINCALDYDDYQLALEVFAYKEQKCWNYTNPFCSTYVRLEHGNYRATLIHHVLNPLGYSKLFMRKLRDTPFELNQFQNNNIDHNFLHNLILNKKNILISGSTGSGKTSFMGSLAQLIPKDEHVIILEDTFELPQCSDRFTRLLASEENNKTLADFMAYSMRMSPDRILLGEIRSKEIIPLILALNTGHKGLLTSLHSNSASDAIHRLAMLFCLHGPESYSYEQVLKLIAKNIDYVIFLQNKSIQEVIEVYGSDKGEIFFEKM